MGKSFTCNYYCEISLSNGKTPIHGVMRYESILPEGRAIASALKSDLVKIAVFPQTKKGMTKFKKDFLIMDSRGNVDHFNCGDSIPFYTF